MPNNLIDSVPAAEGGQIEGAYEDSEEALFLDPNEGVLGEMVCDVAAPGVVTPPGDLSQIVFRAWLTHYQFDDEGEKAAQLREESEAELRQWEEGRTDSQESGHVIDWGPVSAGEGGVAVVSEAVGWHIGEPDALGEVIFTTANVTVRATYHIYGRFEETEELDRLNNLARQLDRALSAEGERVG
ncbi:hypothetical protein ABZ512_20590 [Nocardiopsis dassonvillei]|uniref:hypothetical protein n=1 Tax=Nocardiopsis dassonvillei TaxID=2014 RepID=UPI0033E90F66